MTPGLVVSPHVETRRGRLCEEPVDLGIDGGDGFPQLVDFVLEIVPVVVADTVDRVVEEVVGVVHDVLPEIEQAGAAAAA